MGRAEHAARGDREKHVDGLGFGFIIGRFRIWHAAVLVSNRGLNSGWQCHSIQAKLLRIAIFSEERVPKDWKDSVDTRKDRAWVKLS